MELEAAFLHALHDNPDDPASWLVLADWLEEGGQDDRAELVRLWLALRTTPNAPDREDHEERLRALLAAGTRPCMPVLVNSLGMPLVRIPAGSFWMGSGSDEDDRFLDEGPRHRVRLSRPFYLGAWAVTQEQYQRVMGDNPSHFSASGPGRARVEGLDTRSFPVEGVSWHEAVAFCDRLSQVPEEKAARRVYRLPTEAEWEYACRGAGTSGSPFSFGRRITDAQVNFDSRFPYAAPPGSYRERPVPVGTFPPNVLGLHEMHGNVWEWCSDWFDHDYYRRSPAVDPPGAAYDPEGPDNPDNHVLRGGSWYSTGRVCRSACRNAAANPEARGFRVAMTRL